MFNAAQVSPQVLQFAEHSLWLNLEFVFDVYNEIPLARVTLVQSMQSLAQWTWRYLMIVTAPRPDHRASSAENQTVEKQNIMKVIRSIAPELLRDRDFMFSWLLHVDWEVYQGKDDPNLQSIRYACRFVTFDKQLMVIAVKANPLFYLIASDTLKEDAHLIVTALNKNPSVIDYVPEGVFRDKSVITKILPHLPGKSTRVFMGGNVKRIQVRR